MNVSNAVSRDSHHKRSHAHMCCMSSQPFQTLASIDVIPRSRAQQPACMPTHMPTNLPLAVSPARCLCLLLLLPTSLSDCVCACPRAYASLRARHTQALRCCCCYYINRQFAPVEIMRNLTVDMMNTCVRECHKQPLCGGHITCGTNNPTAITQQSPQNQH